MNHFLWNLQKEAQQIFLGNPSVIGVGIAHNDFPKLLFMLSKDSTETKNEIKRWGHTRDVEVDFQVVGKIT